MVGGTSNASGIIVYTLQQPRASEDIIALIQIKIQVNDPNMNGLFDSDSQYNIIFETLVDKFGFKIQNLIQQWYLWVGLKLVNHEDHKKIHSQIYNQYQLC